MHVCVLLVPVDFPFLVGLLFELRPILGGYDTIPFLWYSSVPYRHEPYQVPITWVYLYHTHACHILPTGTAYVNISLWRSVVLSYSASYKLHTRELPNLCPHTSRMTDLVFILMNARLVLNEMPVHACTFCGQRYSIGYSIVAKIFRSIACVVLVSQVYMSVVVE